MESDYDYWWWKLLKTIKCNKVIRLAYVYKHLVVY